MTIYRWFDGNVGLCEALGLDPLKVSRIVLTFDCGGPPEAVVTFPLLDPSDVIATFEERHYTLHPDDEADA